MTEKTTVNTSDEQLAISADVIEMLVDDVLQAKEKTLTKDEKDAIVQKLLNRKGLGYVRYRMARRNRLKKKQAKAKAAKITGTVASSIGGSAALGLAAAIAAPAVPAFAVSGAVVGLVGGWLLNRQSENRKNE
ncbi:hypothetical protein E8F20_27785 [Pseudomonas sp. BN415]|uniref:hypothetical protein n=1 Tax=Pseudomonas sp. BN415 TaxID=2567889 RepID=UPI002456D45C|nr:hypothetical protein [Pseudomonas sp. BN415]MDH4585653.1 hypothetical protein [Pseudomonas sp. BN415]